MLTLFYSMFHHLLLWPQRLFTSALHWFYAFKASSWWIVLVFVQYWVLLINIDVLCKDVVKNSTAVSMFLSFRASLTIDCNLQTDFRVLRGGVCVSFLSLRIDFVWTVGSRQNWCLAWFCFVCLETEQQINEYEATYSSTAYFAVPSL